MSIFRRLIGLLIIIVGILGLVIAGAGAFFANRAIDATVVGLNSVVDTLGTTCLLYTSLHMFWAFILIHLDPDKRLPGVGRCPQWRCRQSFSVAETVRRVMPTGGFCTLRGERA